MVDSLPFRRVMCVRQLLLEPTFFFFFAEEENFCDGVFAALTFVLLINST
jgi:hypothetical protein